MKKFALLATCCLFLAGFTHAQKYAIIDTKYILDKMPDYKTAQAQLDNIAKTWQKEIDDMQGDLDKMYKNYDAEQVMLSDDLKKKKRGSTFHKRKSCSGSSTSALWF